MIKYVIRLTILSLTVLASLAASAAGDFRWRNLSLDQGLSHSNVTAITRDKRGYLWVGTRFGLNRYDFENIVNYYHNPDDPATIPDNAIMALYSDRRGNLWIAGESGLSVSRDGRTFERITINNKPITVKSFFEEPDGLMMGAPGVIYYYDYRTGTVAPLQTRGGSSGFYTDIISRGNNFYILVTRWDGLWLFDRTSASISRLPGIDYKNIMAAYVDSRGTLWVSPYGQGIMAFDRAGSCIYNCTTANSELPNDIILDITEHDNNIWLATDGGGVAILNPETGIIERCNTEPNNGENSSVTTLFADNNDNLYAGTVRDGVASIMPVAMHTLHSSQHSLSAITSVWPDEREPVIWIGDDGHGVIHYNLETEELTPISSTSGMKVTDIVGHDDDNLLISTFNKGFFLLNKRTGRFTPASADLNKLKEEIGNPAMTILMRRISDKMIAIISDRISFYDPSTGKITGEIKQPQGLTGAMKPFFNRDGRLMCFGTNYITEYDPVTDTHRCLIKLNCNERINCAVFDGAHTIFVATDRGLKEYDTVTREITSDSDINERISAMVCDGTRRLYIATTRSLYIKNRDTGNIIGFGINDGLTPNEYLPNATLVTDNCVLIGGVYGMLRIHPDEVEALMSASSEPDINISEIRVDGTDMSKVIATGLLTVPPHNSDISLSVIDNGNNSQRRQRFRYVISGDGDYKKVIETFARTVDLNFLEQGHNYDVSVSCLTPDGSWTREAGLLTIDMQAPWWNSLWLWIAVALMVAGSLIIYEINRNRRRKATMELQMDHYRRNWIEKELAFFVNTNYALRTPLTLIYAPVKLLLEQLHNGTPTEEIIPALEVIYRNTKKMRDTIEMALELHQINDKETETELSTHDINRSVNDVIASLQHEFEAKHIICTFHHDQEMFPAFYDRDRLRMVIETLLRNAIQRSSDHAGIKIRTAITDNYVRVSISDSGEHLDQETLGGLFSKYFHDDNSKFGNSLSFAYVRNIIDLLGGRTGAENNEGEGITVWFEFPSAGTKDAENYVTRRKSEIKMPTNDSGETIVSDVDTSSLTAIVVEADNDLGIFIANQLSNHFGRVLHAFNGKDALTLIRQYQPDIVISSLMLPVLSGIDLCRTLKKSPETSHIPVILLTSLKEGPQLANAYGAGADSYLSKPFDLQILLTRCKNILHTHSVMKRRYSTASAPKPDDHKLTNADESFILKIDKIINDNLANPRFSVETIVEQTAYSRSALYARFKEITGQSIGAYIADYRLNRAKELLMTQNISINEVSEMLGFSSQRYFSTFFRERTGMSPSAFRQSSKQSADHD